MQIIDDDPTRIPRQKGLLFEFLCDLCFAVVDTWLERIGAGHCAEAFSKHSIDDFFCLPFVRSEVLAKMGIGSVDQEIIMKQVNDLRDMESVACACLVTPFPSADACTPVVALWLECLGYGKYTARFQKEKIRISVRWDVAVLAVDVAQTLRLLTKELLEKLGVDEADRTPLFEHIEYFHYFSSAEGVLRSASHRMSADGFCFRLTYSGLLVAALSWVCQVFVRVRTEQHSVLCAAACEPLCC